MQACGGVGTVSYLLAQSVCLETNKLHAAEQLLRITYIYHKKKPAAVPCSLIPILTHSTQS